MRPPCEVIVKKVLPAIRSILVKQLNEDHNLSQTEIAEKLGITQPAVSQYMKSARGNSEIAESLKEANLYSEVRKLSKGIADGTIQGPQIIEKYCDLCDSMVREEVVCTFHKESAPSLTEEECKVCFKSRKGEI